MLHLVTLFLPYFVLGADVTNHSNWNLLDHEICGDSLSDRIIGGTEAALGEFPWMARLGYQINKDFQLGIKFKCGGSLINHLYVVTAAHCVTELDSTILKVVRLGENFVDTEIDCQDDMCAPPVQDFEPVQIFFHEKYNDPAIRNDIALIRLDRPVIFNDFVKPICLPHGSIMNINYIGTTMDVSGWGLSDKYNFRPSDKLLHVQVPVINNNNCERTYRGEVKLSKKQFCAGGQVGYDSCGGDSGGPLMRPEAVDGPPKYYLIGIVSFGSKKCGSHAPAIYTDVRRYIDWILDNMDP